MHHQITKELILFILKLEPLERALRDDEIFHALKTRNAASRATFRDIQDTLPLMVKDGSLIEYDEAPYVRYALNRSESPCILMKDQAQFCAPI